MPKDYQRLAEKAYDLLEEKVTRLELAPGEIYSEAELSEAIGLGRTPMREALLRLAKERLVEMIPRRGVRISPIDLTKHVALLETRKALDVLIVTRAARRVNAAQKSRLRDYAQRMTRAGARNDHDQYREVDADVDALLTEASRNPFAVEAVAHLYAHCKRFWSYYHDHLDIPRLAQQHAVLTRAVADGDETAARNAVTDIIDDQIAFTRRALDL